MNLSDLHPPEGSRHKKKRLGRGTGSGHGKTSGKGHKGQNARAGGGVRPGFEGGQMPLQRRMPIRGFTHASKTIFNVVNLAEIAALELNEVTPDILREKNLVRRPGPVKILGDGDLKAKVTVRAQAFSHSARQKIQAAGGQAEVV